MKLMHCFLSGALALTAAGLRAQDQDAEGCKDSALITRLPGSTIHSCENKGFEQAKLPLGADQDGNAKEKTVEGDYHYWDYGTREGVSEIQVFRNFEAALKKAGFTIDFEDSPATITAHKGSTWYWLDNKGTFYYQTIVTEKQMEQEVTADASSLSDELNKSGHVAVYGIHFDTAKATIQPDSANILGEIVKLLQQNADLKLRIEGHTDGHGNAAANQALSDKRAQAVVAWLTGKGINASRLTAKGFGATKPVADNTTDDGRAKNRRVELVKM
ncbi:MAG: OmpA family protein [Candidatus Angelobacter sp.]